MTTEAPSQVAPADRSAPMQPTKKKREAPRIAIGVCILAAVIIVYVLSLFGVHLLQRSEGPLPPLDLSQGGGDATIVQLRLEELKPVANRLSVEVLAYPGVSQYDNRFDVLANDVAVRLYPTSDLGDLQYPKGKAPAQLSTTIEAHGDPANWPFDTYRTGVISADVFTGSGANKEKTAARVEATGRLDGWDASVTRVHDEGDSNPDLKDDVVITLHRSKGQLIFDVGICLVLISLPVLALWVAIPVALGRTSFLPPLTTWYGAMLFAIVPLRNILPGSPPYGSWVDQAIVLWVLIGLVAALTLFLVGWWRQRDRKTPTRT